ncbi:MAG TPA: hypothetical protein VFO19_13125, partial [Vicinamibacterales bacterium]|nr:hypothetical protein [Vicinamibacterales bacterium]
DGGSFSVVEGQAFAGEGLMNPLKPGEKRLLSYAIDLGVEVTSKPDAAPTAATKVTVDHGVLIHEREERQRVVYAVRNENADERLVVIEHLAKAGWTMGGSAQPDESTAAWHRYRVPVGARTSAQLTIDEIRPSPVRIAISSVTTPQVELLIKEAEISPALEASLRDVIARKEGIAALGRDIAAHGAEIDRIAADQIRVRENMRALRGTSEERQLLQRYVKQLDDQEDLLARLRRELAALSAMQREAQGALERFIAQIEG